MDTADITRSILGSKMYEQVRSSIKLENVLVRIALHIPLLWRFLEWRRRIVLHATHRIWSRQRRRNCAANEVLQTEIHLRLSSKLPYNVLGI